MSLPFDPPETFPQPAKAYSLTPTPTGVLIAHSAGLALVGPRLTPLWSRSFNGWSVGIRLSDPDVLWYGTVDGGIHLISLANGDTLRRIDSSGGSVSAVAGSIALVSREGGFEAISPDDGVLWRREVPLKGQVVAVDDAFFLTEHWGTRLVSVDAATGLERWQREVCSTDLNRPDLPNRAIPSGFPSLFPTPDGDIAFVQLFGQITRLNGADGSVKAQLAISRPGTFCVREGQVCFHTPQSLSVIDISSMQEVEREDFGASVSELYKVHAASAAHGLDVDDDTIAWTLPSGALLAIERRPAPDGTRRTWQSAVGGLMPLARNPVLFGGSLYWARVAAPGTADTAAVLCYPGRESE